MLTLNVSVPFSVSATLKNYPCFQSDVCAFAC